jgi:predicted glycoside hydrolase/deacetylase ChbG (UPF0249 family)
VKLLIVNADDFGRTPGIDAGILEAHRQGIVSSATLMVNYPAAAAAARAALALGGGLGVGLHVALTGGPAALPREAIPSLVGADGRLPRKPEQLAAAAPDPAQVQAEAAAQLARFVALMGRLPTHLDSHHHAHRLPVVQAALVALARAHGLPLRHPGGADGARRLRAAGVRTTDHFVEEFFGAATGVGDLLRILRDLPEGSTELMCHPARVDEELRAASGYTTPREQELATLTAPAARAALAEHRIALATFADLP